MPQQPFPPAALITTDAALRQLAGTLAREPLLAVDTESNSLYVYREQVCLIQLSTRSADYIVDTLALTDLSPLGALFADPALEKVFHAAEYDIICLKRDYGFEFANLFDTMVAARICGVQAFSLGNLVEARLGITLDKGHQLADWGERPLSVSHLLYAQRDTHYLPALRDIMRAELDAAGLTDEAQELFAELCATAVPDTSFDPEGYWRIGKPAHLAPRELAVLRELYLLREELAQQRNRPPFKIIANSVMVTLAHTAPRTLAELEQVKGLGTRQVARDGDRLLAAITVGLDAPLPRRPEREPLAAPEVLERYQALREWRRDRANARGVESDIILPKDAMWSLAERAPSCLDDMRGIAGLGPWRLSSYGDELLRVLTK
jgi:ribonuclease D